MIDKTRLKNNTLKASVKKMKQQLKQVTRQTCKDFGWIYPREIRLRLISLAELLNVTQFRKVLVGAFINIKMYGSSENLGLQSVDTLKLAVYLQDSVFKKTQ